MENSSRFNLVAVMASVGLLFMSNVQLENPQKIGEGTYAIGRYNIILTNDTCPITPRCGGWTYEDGTVYIKSQRSIGEIIKTCNHEICHNMLDEKSIPNLSRDIEEIMCRGMGKVMQPECEELRRELNAN